MATVLSRAVREAAGMAEPQPGAERVLVYVDGSDASMRAVDRALAIAGEGGRVTALVVVPPRLDRAAVSQFEIEDADLDVRFAEELAAKVVERAAACGRALQPLVLRGPPVDVIVDRARSRDFDVVLVARKPGPRFVADLSETLRRKPGLPLEVVG
ncbi:MAG: universal stress protein [Actinomycetota bacterium]